MTDTASVVDPAVAQPEPETETQVVEPGTPSTESADASWLPARLGEVSAEKNRQRERADTAEAQVAIATTNAAELERQLAVYKAGPVPAADGAPIDDDAYIRQHFTPVIAEQVGALEQKLTALIAPLAASTARQAFWGQEKFKATSPELMASVEAHAADLQSKGTFDVDREAILYFEMGRQLTEQKSAHVQIADASRVAVEQVNSVAAVASGGTTPIPDPPTEFSELSTKDKWAALGDAGVFDDPEDFKFKSKTKIR